MNKFQQEYNQKKVSVEEALSHIRIGDVVCPSGTAMEPLTLLSNLHTIAEKGVRDVYVYTSLERKQYPFQIESAYREFFTVDSMFLGPFSRKLHEEGGCGFLPQHLHAKALRLFANRKPTVALISVTPMDSHGYLLCSLSQTCESDLIDVADIVIAEVNPNFPRVGGDTPVHISKIDWLTEVNTPVPQIVRTDPSELHKTIGGYISELVNDGDTIQLGIGAIPDAAANAFLTKKNLGVHTEMLTNSITTLVDAGVVNCSKKNINRGKIIATFALGDQKLYDMADNNPAIEIRKGTYVNDSYVIAQNDNMVSINSCITVDLTGQVNSESIGSRQYSGTGGASDFAIGASLAKNGRSIIALTSTAKNGTLSSIVPVLAPGAIVSILRNDVDYVITEYGIAPLKGRSIRERIANLIGIAHPDFRNELEYQAQKFYAYGGFSPAL